MWRFRPSLDSTSSLTHAAPTVFLFSHLPEHVRPTSLRRRQWERGDVVATLSATIISVQLPANYWMKTEDPVTEQCPREREKEREVGFARARASGIVKQQASSGNDRNRSWIAVSRAVDTLQINRSSLRSFLIGYRRVFFPTDIKSDRSRFFSNIKIFRTVAILHFGYVTHYSNISYTPLNWLCNLTPLFTSVSEK